MLPPASFGEEVDRPLCPATKRRSYSPDPFSLDSHYHPPISVNVLVAARPHPRQKPTRPPSRSVIPRADGHHCLVSAVPCRPNISASGETFALPHSWSSARPAHSTRPRTWGRACEHDRSRIVVLRPDVQQVR